MLSDQSPLASVSAPFSGGHPTDRRQEEEIRRCVVKNTPLQFLEEEASMMRLAFSPQPSPRSQLTPSSGCGLCSGRLPLSNGSLSPFACGAATLFAPDSYLLLRIRASLVVWDGQACDTEMSGPTRALRAVCGALASEPRVSVPYLIRAARKMREHGGCDPHGLASLSKGSNHGRRPEASRAGS
jgi:hypothetical protein